MIDGSSNFGQENNVFMTKIEGLDPCTVVQSSGQQCTLVNRNSLQSVILPVRVLSPEEAVTFSGMDSVWLVFRKPLT